jgi:hypothetical protein
LIGRPRLFATLEDGAQSLLRYAPVNIEAAVELLDLRE